MTPFFSTPERVAALRTEAQSWLWTPFRQGCCVKGKGGGVDCVGFVLACFEAAGVVRPGEITIPPYDIDHAQTGETFPLVEWFKAEWVRKRVTMMDRADPKQDGDLCFVKYAKGVHHLGLWLDGMVWHTMRRQFVMAIRPENIERLRGEIQAPFRPIESEVTPARA